MSFADTVTAAIADAMRSKDVVRLRTLRMLKAALTNRAVERGRDLDDGEAMQVVGTLVKQRRESIDQFTRGGRPDLAQKESEEIAVLDAFLPPPLDQAALERAVSDAITETGASSVRDMGRVMKSVMAKLAGQNADGKAINELVRTKLGGV